MKTFEFTNKGGRGAGQGVAIADTIEEVIAMLADSFPDDNADDWYITDLTEVGRKRLLVYG